MVFFRGFQNKARVAVAGASGGIGQPLSLLLKQSPLVSELSLYDIVHAPGVAADLSHIETKAKVTGYNGNEQMAVSIRNQWSSHHSKTSRFRYESLSRRMNRDFGELLVFRTNKS